MLRLQGVNVNSYNFPTKVKNKLDARVYALKRIKLNPRNKALNRKITREVKLLSRLNHENVVRYYNSWIESAIISSSELTGSETPSSQQTPATPTPLENHLVPQSGNGLNIQIPLCYDLHMIFL